MGNFTFRRSELVKIGGFIEFPCAFGSDITTPIALSKNGVANTPEMLFCYRISSRNLSSDSSRYIERLEAISQLFEWLQTIDYEMPNDSRDKDFYLVMNPDYLHKKVVYDYFNQVIQYLPFTKLNYLKYCRMASSKDKIMMLLRWVKRHIAS